MSVRLSVKILNYFLRSLNWQFDYLDIRYAVSIVVWIYHNLDFEFHSPKIRWCQLISLESFQIGASDLLWGTFWFLKPQFQVILVLYRHR